MVWEIHQFRADDTGIARSRASEIVDSAVFSRGERARLHLHRKLFFLQ